MFVADGKSGYDRVCADLLELAWKTVASANAPDLLGSIEDGCACIPLFGERCSVRRDGVYKESGKLDTIGSILVLRYLLQAGSDAIRHIWLPYRDLKDGSQFSGFIKTNIEDKMARAFEGRAEALSGRLSALGAVPAGSDVGGDVRLVVHPLPKLPVLCLFWDRDEEFPASFQFLFDASATSFLDLEALAVVLQYIHMKAAGAG